MTARSVLLLMNMTTLANALFTSKYYHCITSIYWVGKFKSFLASLPLFSSRAYLFFWKVFIEGNAEHWSGALFRAHRIPALCCISSCMSTSSRNERNPMFYLQITAGFAMNQNFKPRARSEISISVRKSPADFSHASPYWTTAQIERLTFVLSCVSSSRKGSKFE